MNKEDPDAALIAQRNETHGAFADVSVLTQSTINIWSQSKNWQSLSDVRKMALYEIAHKAARILVGDPNHLDHWDDVGGYARLGRDNQSKERS